MIKRILLVAVLSLGPALLATTRAAAGGCEEVTSGHSSAVGLKGLCIFPTLVRMPSGGGDVTFTNYDDVDHVIMGAGYAWGSDAIMHQGDSFTARFTRDGVYPFQCYLHPGMSGAVLVGDSDARGAATSGGVRLPVPSDAAATPSPATVENVEPQTTSGQTPWWLGVAGVVIAAAAAIAVSRSRRRGSKVSQRPTAET